MMVLWRVVTLNTRSLTCISSFVNSHSKEGTRSSTLQERSYIMATGGLNSVFSADESKLDLVKQLRSHQVAIAELSSLSSSRCVYQRKGNIYFKSTIQKATAGEEKELNLVKAKLERQDAAA